MEQAAVWIPYCGAAPLPADLVGRWNLDPVLIVLLLLSTGWLISIARIARERQAAIVAAIMLLLLFISPFCALTSALFSARAVHHLILTAIAAPMLAIALPQRMMAGGVGLWAGVHAATFWLWHAPVAYEAAMSSHGIYWAMQVSLLMTAVALWQTVRAAALPAGIAALLATMVQMGLLGALLTFIGTPLYAPHALGPLGWGFTPAEDQQLAGLIMWAPGAGLYLAAALTLASRWIEREGTGAPAT